MTHIAIPDRWRARHKPRLVRPYIPLEIRCIVAWRQCAERGVDTSAVVNKPLGRRLRHLLIMLFAGRKHDLHHRPALENRPMDSKTGRYIPDANDENFLVYLENNSENNEHYIETHIRGHGALRSDTAEKMHRKRLDQNRGLIPRKPKRKIQSKGFPSSATMPRVNRRWWGSRKMESRSWK